MKKLVVALTLVCATPAVGQAVPKPQASPGATAIDPARLVAARPVVTRIWPLGTYKRLMSSTVQNVMDGVMTQMMGMKASEVVGTAATGTKGETEKVLGDSSIADLAKAADPAFEERTRITMRVMFEEMGALMTAVEPQVQDAVAHALARRFTVAELAELGQFFATPVGARYAADSMLLTVDPEMMGAMAKFMPTFMQAMPGIMKKVEAATAHLPPPPKPKKEDAEDEPEEQPRS